MTSNVGAWPIDPTTSTGLFRFEVGDTVGTQIGVTATAEFEFMSDATINALLLAYPDSIDTAKAKALQSMATQLIAAAQDIQVGDIKIKTIERANIMLKMANTLMSIALGLDVSSAFSIVPLSYANSYAGAPLLYGPSGY